MRSFIVEASYRLRHIEGVPPLARIVFVKAFHQDFAFCCFEFLYHFFYIVNTFTLLILVMIKPGSMLVRSMILPLKILLTIAPPICNRRRSDLLRLRNSNPRSSKISPSQIAYYRSSIALIFQHHLFVLYFRPLRMYWISTVLPGRNKATCS